MHMFRSERHLEQLTVPQDSCSQIFHKKAKPLLSPVVKVTRSRRLFPAPSAIRIRVERRRWPNQIDNPILRSILRLISRVDDLNLDEQAPWEKEDLKVLTRRKETGSLLRFEVSCSAARHVHLGANTRSFQLVYFYTGRRHPSHA